MKAIYFIEEEPRVSLKDLKIGDIINDGHEIEVWDNESEKDLKMLDYYVFKNLIKIKHTKNNEYGIIIYEILLNVDIARIDENGNVFDYIENQIRRIRTILKNNEDENNLGAYIYGICREV